MTVDDLLKFYKATNDADLAKKIKRGRTTIFYWRSGGIPSGTQAKYEILTKGKLKADLKALTASRIHSPCLKN